MIKAFKIYCIVLMWVTAISAVASLIIGDYLIMTAFIVLYTLERISWNELND